MSVHWRHLSQLHRHLGIRWLFLRGTYAAQQHLGWLERRLPSLPWEDQGLETLLSDRRLAHPERYLAYRWQEAPRFFFKPKDRLRYQGYFQRWDGDCEEPQALIERLLAGHWRFFGGLWLNTGFPPDWHRNALTGERAPSDHHWSRVSDFTYGDIRVIWELNRFGFAYALVRAYWRTGDERYPQIFWDLVEHWREHNSPQLGPNWKCGQEITFRVMAWIFGLYGSLDARATTAERVVHLAQMIGISGQRIAGNIRYALSQRNNHGISEAVGLWTIGLLFPEFREAPRWREQGRELLEQQGRELIYSDGAFSQHSANYHRLMLHDYLWACRLGELHGQPFSEELKARIRRAAEFLYQIQDEYSGRVPCYGQNDGSLILPLNNCDQRDFRPVVQAVTMLTEGVRRYDSGPWDEDLLWLFGPRALIAPVVDEPRRDRKATAGGCYTLRSANGFAFIRCGEYKHRPSQADMLHVDLWWRGQNIAIDPGTYSYNAPDPWDNPLAHARYHNTLTVDGLDPMERVSRFLWLPWVNGRLIAVQRSPSGHLAYWEGEHDGYRRLPDPVSHRRAVVHGADDCWVIIDRLWGRAQHAYRLHWLLADFPYEWKEGQILALHTPEGVYHLTLAGNEEQQVTLVRGDRESPRGWYPPYYSVRQPALSLVAQVYGQETFWMTIFSPEAALVHFYADTCQVKFEDASLEIEIADLVGKTLVRALRLEGRVSDHLEVSGCASS
ncbi:MAG: hypothetical protein KatS3mg081_0027 [Gemmatimonadales bacterium]|nr:MAG: hypothetical protein KatS3mg081_0027 [Gemmatimonadales bacterium]